MNRHYPFKAEPLPYYYDYLEPCIDVETLHYHHDRHYVTYVENLNKALKDYPQYHNTSLENLIINIPNLPKELQTPVTNNGGGVFNHELYFNKMKRAEGQMPSPEMQTRIRQDFGSFENWKKQMTDVALGVFGSGWAWLIQNKITKTLSVVPTPNQKIPDLTKYTPLLTLDVWEHAYYLQYKNLRAEYVKCWFGLINWNKI